MMSEATYYTFLRSARNFEEFASAEKQVVDTGLSYAEARAACEEFNADRSDGQREAGTKMEFTKE